MKKLLITLSFIAIGTFLIAQSITVRGKVSNGKEPLIGVSIVQKGTANGTISDIDGKYEIQIENKSTLVFSYIGYQSQEAVIDNQRTLDIVLVEDAQSLNEVVVVGYGTQRKSDLTGSVGSVKSKDIQGIATPSVEQVLQGKIAGVMVTPASGSPGAGAIIRIRGTGTLNNTNPLFVVDGMMTDDISFLNPNEIESVDILKDASATAIYGSRGANGVVMVTTKRGKAGQKGIITLSSFYSSQELQKKIGLANATQYAQLRNLAAKNANPPQPIPYPNPESFGVGTDWQDVIFRTAPMQNINLAARGGNESMVYSVSGDYLKQDGILRGGDYERLSLRINNEYKINNIVKIGHNLSIVNTKSNNSPGVLYNAYYAPPTVAPRDSSGKFGNTTSDGSVGNPEAQFYYERYNKSSALRTFGNLYMDLNLLKGLTFRTNLGLDWTTSEGKRFVPVYRVTDIQKNEVNALDVYSNKYLNKLWENTLTYDKTIGKHHFTFLTGITAQMNDNYLLSGRSTNLPNDVNNIEGDIEDLLYLSAGTKGFSASGGSQDSEVWNMFSVLYRANYSFNNKYLLTASGRRDGSSKFGKNRRYGNFPSMALGWRAKEEAFLKDIDWLSNLKFRASWGIIGNDKISSESKSPPVTGRLDAVFGTDEKFIAGATINRLANPDLHWEETHQTDIGFEIGFLNNRLTAEIDWYSRKTKDILTALQIPAFIGASEPPVVNAASVLNSGWDINLGWKDRIKSGLDYHFNAIISTVHNEVLNLGEGKEEILGGGVGEGGKLGSRTTVGSVIGAFYGYKVVGVYQNAEQLSKLPKRTGEVPNKDVFVGDLIYADIDGDGVITSKDRTYLGSPIPKMTYSFNLGLGYKGVDISAQIYGLSGNKLMNAKRLARFSTGNFETAFLNGWTGEGTSNFEPRVTIGGRNYEVSERFLEDGSFTSIRNLQVGYTLPLSISSKVKLQNFRIYVAATNLKVWTKYSGYTPEIVNGGDSFAVGIDRGVYPVARTYTIGLNASF